MEEKTEQKVINLNFSLTLDETNFILAEIGKESYVKVVGLIEKIKQQAQPQLMGEQPQAPVKPQVLTETGKEVKMEILD